MKVSVGIRLINVLKMYMVSTGPAKCRKIHSVYRKITLKSLIFFLIFFYFLGNYPQIYCIFLKLFLMLCTSGICKHKGKIVLFFRIITYKYWISTLNQKNAIHIDFKIEVCVNFVTVSSALREHTGLTPSHTEEHRDSLKMVCSQ